MQETEDAQIDISAGNQQESMQAVKNSELGNIAVEIKLEQVKNSL